MAWNDWQMCLICGWIMQKEIIWIQRLDSFL